MSTALLSEERFSSQNLAPLRRGSFHEWPDFIPRVAARLVLQVWACRPRNRAVGFQSECLPANGPSVNHPGWPRYPLFSTGAISISVAGFEITSGRSVTCRVGAG